MSTKSNFSAYTALSYLYRDASNYRQSTTVYLTGTLSTDDLMCIQRQLEDGRYFLPEQVGLFALQGRFLTGVDPEDDHVWHELDLPGDAVALKALPEGESAVMSAEALVTAFRTVTWDVALAQSRLEALCRDEQAADPLQLVL